MERSIQSDVMRRISRLANDDDDDDDDDIYSLID